MSGRQIVAKKPLISNRKELLGDCRKEGSANSEIYRFQSNLNGRMVGRPRFELWVDGIDDAGFVNSSRSQKFLTWGPFEKAADGCLFMMVRQPCGQRVRPAAAFTFTAKSRQGSKILPR